MSANIIILGGTIAAGKSTIGELLANETGFEFIREINEDDKLQQILLRKLYEGKRIDIETIEYYFVGTRVKQYTDNSHKLITAILDRGIWEDIIFAKILTENDPEYFQIFKKFWEDTIRKLINDMGRPKLYIYLKVDWESFKERLFSRGRSAEVSNFNRNKEYFEKLLDEYVKDFVNILKSFHINHIVIDTTKMTKKEIVELIKIELKQLED